MQMCQLRPKCYSSLFSGHGVVTKLQFTVVNRRGCQHEYTSQVSEDDCEEQRSCSAGDAEHPWQQHQILHSARQLAT